jgi:hypothetical protein
VELRLAENKKGGDQKNDRHPKILVSLPIVFRGGKTELGAVVNRTDHRGH